MTDPQRSTAWFAARAGKLTASRFADAVALTLKGTPTAARTTYLHEVVVERLTGRPTERFESVATRWGTEQEPAAIAAYQSRTGREVMGNGFIAHPTCSYAGASPDGLLAHHGTVEVKCPYNSATHIATWIGGMPGDHMAQVQGQLWVTGRQFCDFVSYDPRMPDGLVLYVERVERDAQYIETLASGLARAWMDVLTIEGELIEKSLRQWETPLSKLEHDLKRSIEAAQRLGL